MFIKNRIYLLAGTMVVFSSALFGATPEQYLCKNILAIPSHLVEDPNTKKLMTGTRVIEDAHNKITIVDGLLVERVSINESGSIYFTEYHKDGHLIKIVQKNNDNTTSTSIFDNEGRESKRETLDARGLRVNSAEYQIDGRGTLTNYDTEGDPLFETQTLAWGRAFGKSRLLSKKSKWMDSSGTVYEVKGGLLSKKQVIHRNEKNNINGFGEYSGDTPNGRFHSEGPGFSYDGENKNGLPIGTTIQVATWPDKVIWTNAKTYSDEGLPISEVSKYSDGRPDEHVKSQNGLPVYAERGNSIDVISYNGDLETRETSNRRTGKLESRTVSKLSHFGQSDLSPFVSSVFYSDSNSTPSSEVTYKNGKKITDIRNGKYVQTFVYAGGLVMEVNQTHGESDATQEIKTAADGMRLLHRKVLLATGEIISEIKYENNKPVEAYKRSSDYTETEITRPGNYQRITEYNDGRKKIEVYGSDWLHGNVKVIDYDSKGNKVSER
jgi:hypothetical protein